MGRSLVNLTYNDVYIEKIGVRSRYAQQDVLFVELKMKLLIWCCFMDIDFDRLREDLIDYFGTAMGMFPMAEMDVSKVERASDGESIKIAKQNGFDLRKYEEERR